ncbi:cellulase family glycosylhydrolase [Demequina salsinemoris]|uniref:cellulase family glycosylhydrolase n=1 Tax=Demequina salsinemoris TaxID=577470 RepID=UPI0007843C4C|nr:cellulase family glycosylhydrolase [Demequina salsinemoris]
MRPRWTPDEARRWYEDKQWISGFNFIPSGAIDGPLWLLQSYDHDAAYRDAAREIALAASLGLNSIRFYLPFEVWRYERDAFFANLDQLLDLLEVHGMTMMPVIFNDCSVPKARWREPALGPQPEPVPGHFGGDAEGAFSDDVQSGDAVGYVITDEADLEPLFKEYVTSLATRYGQDDRVLLWNVWNEVGNSQRGDRSVGMMERTFAWLRAADIEQPLTAEVWGGGATSPFSWMNDPVTIPGPELRAVELSDVVSFHYYGDYSHARQLIATLRQFERPLFNTEWMHRPYGSIIQTHLPLWKREEIGSYFFGFVNGKCQLHEAWDFIKGIDGVDTRLWMHDIFHDDFTPYDAEEIAVLKELNGVGR